MLRGALRVWIIRNNHENYKRFPLHALSLVTTFQSDVIKNLTTVLKPSKSFIIILLLWLIWASARLSVTNLTIPLLKFEKSGTVWTSEHVTLAYSVAIARESFNSMPRILVIELQRINLAYLKETHPNCSVAALLFSLCTDLPIIFVYVSQLFVML